MDFKWICMSYNIYVLESEKKTVGLMIPSSFPAKSDTMPNFLLT